MSAALTNILANLSYTQFEYRSIFPTALSQLDHLFLVIGNGYGYHPESGICDEINAKGKAVRALIRKRQLDFDAVERKYKEREKDQEVQYRELLEQMQSVNASEKLASYMEGYRETFGLPEYVLRDEQYYFDPEAIAAEFIQYSIADNERRNRINDNAYWSTPYPICEYSKIMKVEADHQPETVRLALATAKAWLIVLDYYKENELYLSEDEVNANSFGLAHYKGLPFINQQYETLVGVIQKLENTEAKDD